MSEDVIVVDGSMGEGGGQILRTALSLSVITGKPVRITNIRAKRSRPGLRSQHLTAVKALAEISSARVEGAFVDSMEISFYPSTVKGGVYKFEVGTAGSVSLIIQAILPPLLFARDPSTVKLSGGTDVPFAPTIDYIRYVFKRNLSLTGASFDVVLHRRGHYPKGGGMVELVVERAVTKFKPINAVERGEVLEVRGVSHAVRLPFHVASRQALAARNILKEKLGNVGISIELEHYRKDWDPHIAPGSGITLWAVCGKTLIGADSLGARGKPAEKVGEEAAARLIEELSTGKAFDSHMSDMVLLYVALAEGTSRIGGSRMTLHAKTLLDLLDLFLGGEGFSYTITEGGELNESFTLEIRGVGLTGF